MDELTAQEMIDAAIAAYESGEWGEWLAWLVERWNSVSPSQ